MGTLVGYIRTSSTGQSLDLQRDAMKSAGVERVFADEAVSGSRSERPGLNAALDYLRAGDTLVVWKLDRLGRNTAHIIELVTATLKDRGVSFRSLTEGFDTSNAMGEFFLTVLAAIANLERSWILERSAAGREAARARGRMGGRPRALDERGVKQALSMYSSKSVSIKQIAAALGVSVSTIHRAVREAKPRAKRGRL